MQHTETLEGKKLLIVDDEPDILESLKETLDMCIIDSASDYDTAHQFLDSNTYDAVILDIMGVRGYDLLYFANQKGIPAIMLTAHALSPDNLIKSVQKGAHAYLPKEKISETDIFLSDVLMEIGNKSRGLGKWFDRLKTYYEKKFGPGWLDKHPTIYY